MKITKATRSVNLLRRFKKRSLVGGLVIEISVTEPQKIGKVTRLTTRSGRHPVRRALCLRPDSTNLRSC